MWVETQTRNTNGSVSILSLKINLPVVIIFLKPQTKNLKIFRDRAKVAFENLNEKELAPYLKLTRDHIAK